MKAILCEAYGPPSQLTLQEIDSPVPGPGQVLVRVEACGVNFPDILLVEGKYQQKPSLPFAPGGEICGTVAALGEGVLAPAIGSRVAALMTYGGFAEEVVLDAASLVPVPDGVEPVAAAAVCLAYGTVLHGLRDRGALRPGETLLVLGAAGGTGMAAIQLGKLLGARVIAAASSEAKRQACLAAGADAVVDYTDANWREALRGLTEGRGPDVVFDPVGGAVAEPALRSIAWRGRYLVVGFASGEIPRLAFNLALLKGCSITGVFYGDFARREKAAQLALLAELFAWVAEGRLAPLVSESFPLAQAVAALERLAARQATGKLVLLTHAAPPPAQ
ncbi:NADPH:quinone oxidoreductase family protein [Roseomonas sp. 18066]|uniref:NADPH:quinone oxidoreductase family protein n=1 Tax=Roseomonas sp. 18066 TaxID=2681412 RepID=UPI0013572EDC|nr:NADPH:quinone oxidoreductase family protein [Roseomonas sp. 18066]